MSELQYQNSHPGIDPGAAVTGAEIDSVETWLNHFQNDLCSAFEAHEPVARFHRDTWERPAERGGGGGDTAVLDGGDVFERAGVARSVIHGNKLPPSATARNPHLTGKSWRAMGVSVVVHPRNPFAPTAHLNVRMFTTVATDDERPIWWFGGGFDLTPYYGFEEDCALWHKTAAEVCAPYGESVYPDFKQACDAYFYLPHREEPRGIGGIFYDDMTAGGFNQCFAFMKDVGRGFQRAYLPIIERRKDTDYQSAHRDWQLYRRGRYVEFNLVHDRGTLFGLQSGGRTESILMSMPPLVRWEYRHTPSEGSREAALLREFLPPRQWV